MKSRLFRMVLFLVGRGKSTVSELSDRFEVSKKTIERDISRLSSAGVPVRCERGRNGGVFMDSSYRIDRSFLDETEIEDVILALHLLRCINGKGRGMDVMDAMSAFMPNQTNAKRQELEEYLHVELVGDGTSFARATFEVVNDSLDSETYLDCVVSGERVLLAPFLMFCALRACCCIAAFETEAIAWFPLEKSKNARSLASNSTEGTSFRTASAIDARACRSGVRHRAPSFVSSRGRSGFFR